MKQNLRNHDFKQQLALIQLLHDGRKFFPTDRQHNLYRAILSAPYPTPDAKSDPDHLTLPRYRPSTP